MIAFARAGFSPENLIAIGRFSDSNMQQHNSANKQKQQAFIRRRRLPNGNGWRHHIGIDTDNKAAIACQKKPTQRAQVGRWRVRKAYAPEKSRSWYLWPIVVLAIETAKRRGEILGLRWEHIDLGRKTAFLPITRNGSPRHVPLNDKALDMLKGVPRDTQGPLPITDTAFRQA